MMKPEEAAPVTGTASLRTILTLFQWTLGSERHRYAIIDGVTR